MNYINIPPPIVITFPDTENESNASSCSSYRKKYLFKQPITIDPLLVVLTAVAPCIDGRWYHFNVTSFRKMIFQNLHVSFIESIRNNYFPAKWRKYGDKELTYTSFTTILRQMCNETGRSFYTKIVYDHSVCTTVYFVSTKSSEIPSSVSSSLHSSPHSLSSKSTDSESVW